MIGIGNGSDQILDIILSNFASKKTKILTSNPTFGFFEERCKLYQIPTIKVPFAKDMTLDLDDFISKFNKSKSALPDISHITFNCTDSKSEMIVGYSSNNTL